MENKSLVNLRLMTHQDLEQVLQWRNHKGVRQFMYTQHVITQDEHQKWYEQAIRNSGIHLLIFENNGIASGFVNIKQHGINPTPVADWGFYLAPNTEKGTGKLLGNKTLEYVFNTLKLHKLCGQALAFNERSIKVHLKLGFKQEGILREHHFDGRNYHDVVCFGLLINEWNDNKQ